MSGHAYGRHAARSPSEQFRESTDFLRWELVPDERVGPPIVRRRWPRWLVVGAVALAGGGWALIDDKAATIAWLRGHAASAIALGEAMLAERTRSPAPPPVALPPLRLLDAGLRRAAFADPLPPRETAAADGASPTAPDTTARSEAAETSAQAPESKQESNGEVVAEVSDKPAPLPPLPPLTDPLQKKAEAAGLHPELSRALLQSLSAADFKNAAIAVRKAVAETPEDGVFVWPAKPTPGRARFRIHFVPGISQACRRYVVGVAKSGWLTTALPMERCGVKPRLARSHTAAKDPHDGASHP
jgi:hypothetical protein